MFFSETSGQESHEDTDWTEPRRQPCTVGCVAQW